MELLVSIGIIAVLLGILSPALRSAIGAARDTVCLSNQRQIALGWNLYTNDHTTFPHGEATYSDIQITPDRIITRLNGNSVELMRDWGGVDWYSDSELPFDEKARKLNPYIGGDKERLQARAEIFRCPRDDGLLVDFRGHGIIDSIEYSWGGGSGQKDYVSLSHAENAGETIYSVSGTSYRANDWIWAPIGNPIGFNKRGFLGAYQATTGGNRPTDVEEPSNFVLTGDWGTLVIGRLPMDRRMGFPFGWWHGVDVCNMAFLDGSARRIEMQPGKAAAADYTFYLDRTKHKSSYLVAWGG